MLASLALAGALMSSGPLSDLEFMAGEWTCEIWGGTFEERWAPPVGNAMLGTGRHIVKEETSFMEFFTIEKKGDAVTLYLRLGALSQESDGVDSFAMTDMNKGSATFERDGDDYPTKVVYVEVEGGLKCTLSGLQDGKNEDIVFDFKPIKDKS